MPTGIATRALVVTLKAPSGAAKTSAEIYLLYWNFSSNRQPELSQDGIELSGMTVLRVLKVAGSTRRSR